LKKKADQTSAETISALEIHSRIKTRDGFSLTLTRRKPDRLVPRREPVLFIHGIGQDRRTWDLGRRGFALDLAGRGLDTWIFEARGLGLSRRDGSLLARIRPYRWNFDTMVKNDLDRVIKYVLTETGAKGIFLCGHSLGGMMTYAYVPGHQELVRGFVTLGGPTILGKGSIPMHLIFRANRAPLLGGRLTYAEFLPFFPLGAVGRAALLGFPLLQSPAESLVPLHPWHFLNVYPQDVRVILRKGFGNIAPGILKQMTIWATEGKFVSADRKVNYLNRMKKIRVPCLFFAGDRDRLAPLISVKPGFDLVPIQDKILVHLDQEITGVHWGHLDLTMGKHAPEWVWKKSGDWILERAGN
jgi:pimeloyl-ACP methyl ester carboxylesterase